MSIPRYWDAWERLVPRWRKSAQMGRIQPGIPCVVGELESVGWESRGIGDWIPSESEAERLKRAQDQMGIALNPCVQEHLRDEAFESLLREIRAIRLHGSMLAELAELYRKGRESGRGSSPPPPKPNPKAEAALPVGAPQVREIREFELAHREIGDFGIRSGVVSIYIDETEVGHEWGSVSGIVWDGDQPVESALPRIPPHEKSPESLPELLSCKQCLPFVMPLRPSDGEPNPKQEQIVVACLQMLLGWLLPSPANRVPVRIYLEQYSQHGPGEDWKAYIMGRFDEAASWFGKRFSAWRIDAVEWQGKDFGYLQWGDLLGYWHLEEKVRRVPFAPVSLDELPGFVPLSTDLLNRLKRLEFLEKTGAVADILDILADTAGTRLQDFVAKDMQERLASRIDLQEKLLRELDSRYLAKDRDLGRLGRMLAQVGRLVPAAGENAPVRMRLLWAALKLQDANHSGNPGIVEQAIPQYEEMRETGMQCDLELAAHVDLNLCVHFADCFDFGEAQALAERLIHGQRFAALTLGNQARAWSSLGQHCAMQGQNREAEEHFARAVELFEKDAGLSPEQKQKEIDQTSVYRAVNAMDGELPEAIEFLRRVVGDPKKSVEALSGSLDRPYHQYLLARYLWGFPAELQDAENAYLAGRANWKTGAQHPWQLVAMYRGLLLWRADEEGSPRCFSQAMDIALRAHCGATMHLVGAMAATASWCVHRAPESKAVAERELGEIEKALPQAVDAVGALRSALGMEGEDGVREALRALPFNYR